MQFNEKNLVNLDQITQFLAEDVGSGDLTSSIIPEHVLASASVITRDQMVFCGQAWFSQIFAVLDSTITIDWHVSDGEEVEAGHKLCDLQGPARPLLTGERVALNITQTLSATATISRKYADAIQGCKTKILDTRKTLPGLRNAQKYAVRCGGCVNHRFGLYDGILIKENHVTAAGSIVNAVKLAKLSSRTMPVEVEVESINELIQANEADADRVLLDNFSLDMMREAVLVNLGKAELEASGNISLDNLREIAETGVDFISVGALTKNITAIDLSMRVRFLN